MMRRNGIPEVTILINNAAILMQRPFLEQNYEDVEKIFNVNVLSNFWVFTNYFNECKKNAFNNLQQHTTEKSFYRL